MMLSKTLCRTLLALIQKVQSHNLLSNPTIHHKYMKLSEGAPLTALGKMLSDYQGQEFKEDSIQEAVLERTVFHCY